MKTLLRHGGWLAAVLLALGMLRLFALVLHAPLAGYANQYDMVRTSACIGLWPDVPAEQRAVATPDAPRTDYRRGGDAGPGCYPSTAVPVVAAALALDAASERLRGSDARDFDLRQLGLLYGLIAAAIGIALHRGLRDHPGWQVGHAAVFALVLADPFNTLFFNTLYTEASALLALYAALAILLRLALGARAGTVLLLGFAVALLALGFSRVQHLLQPLALALPAAWLLWPRGGRARLAGIGLLLLALLVPIAQLHQQQDSPSIAAANRSNAVLAGLLPAAADPVRMATRLGLPAHCASLEHLSWYRTRGRDVDAECPELARLPIWRLGTALLLEPKAALVLAGRGLAQASAWRLPYLGELAGASHARVPHPSVADAFAARSFMFHAVLWLAPMLLLLLRLPALLRRRDPPRDVLLFAAVAVVASTWASALLGDGYSELTRHLHLAQGAVLFAWVLVGTWVATALALRSPRVPLQMAGSLALAGIVAFALLRLPLASGVIDLEHVEGGALEVSGWALDPSGIQSLTLTVEDTAYPMALQSADDVARIFPLAGARGPAVARFRLLLPALAAPGRLGLQVHGGHGQVTDADSLVPLVADNTDSPAR